MAERIINVTCPNCKHGIKHDTLMNTTMVAPPEEYPEPNEHDRCWCKMCQHGTYFNEDGLCVECLQKGRETRLRPEEGKVKKKPELNIAVDTAEVSETVAADIKVPESDITDDSPAVSKSQAKRIKIQKKTEKIEVKEK